MHSCKDITEDVTRFVEGEMSWSEWSMFKVHLMMCKPCMVYVESMNLTIDALAKMAPEDPDAKSDRRALMDIFEKWHSAPDAAISDEDALDYDALARMED